jgi:hypothetical protein
MAIATREEPMRLRPASPGVWVDVPPRPAAARGIAWRLFLTCWLVYALHFATNTVREIYPALSLGDHLSLDVSEYVGLHPDIFEIPGRGAFINNNPGASIVGAVPYVLARPVIDRVVEGVQKARAGAASVEAEYRTIYPMAQEFYRKARERGLDVKFGLAAAVMQAFAMAPLSALSAVVMFRILASITASVRAAMWLTLLYAFATPVFYRTAQLNQNLLVGHFALFAFALLWRPWDNPRRSGRPRYLLAGLLSGVTLALDYSGLVVIASVGLYACLRRAALPAGARSRSDLVYFAAGVLGAVSVLLGYQWVSFGNPFYPAQYYMPATAYSQQGYLGMAWPRPDLLWESAFGIRFGLFTSAPLLLLALWVPGWLRERRIIGTLETWWVLGFSLLFFLFSAANQYGHLQFNSGVRYMVPVSPFLFLLAAGAMLRLPVFLASLVGVFGTYWSWCLAMHRDVEQGWGIFEALRRITLEGFRLPWLTTLEGLGYVDAGASALPLLTLMGVVLWILWALGPPARDPGPFLGSAYPELTSKEVSSR